MICCTDRTKVAKNMFILELDIQWDIKSKRWQVNPSMEAYELLSYVSNAKDLDI